MGTSECPGVRGWQGEAVQLDTWNLPAESALRVHPPFGDSFYHPFVVSPCRWFYIILYSIILYIYIFFFCVCVPVCVYVIGLTTLCSRFQTSHLPHRQAAQPLSILPLWLISGSSRTKLRRMPCPSGVLSKLAVEAECVA